MRNKLLSALLSVVLASVGLSFSVCAQTSTELLDEAKQLINYFADEELFTDGSVPRGEFVYAAVKISGIETYSKYETYYNDVPPESKYSNEINQACAFGYISEGEKFEPERSISINEAIKIVMEVLGYGDAAQSNGGYPEGYLYYANTVKLLKNLPDKAEDLLTCDNAYIILYNALYAQRCETNLVGNIKKEYNTDVDCLLNDVHHIYRFDGIVTATPYNSIGGKICAEGYIEIDSELYEYDAADPELLGRKYRVYYTDEDDILGIVLLLDRSGDSFSVSVRDNAELVNNRIKYYENERQKTKKLDDGYFLIYNGRRKDRSKEFIIPRLCDLSMYDNDDDGDYDILSITEYDYTLVESIDTEKLIIRDSNSYEKTIDMSDSDCRYIIYDSNGELSNIFKIKVGELIRTAVSEDKEFIRLYTDSEMKDGTVESFSDSESSIIIDGDKYYLSDYFKAYYYKKLKSGISATFIINNGIVAVINPGDVYRYGYSIKAFVSEDGETLRMKIFTDNGDIVTYDVNDKPIIDGSSCKNAVSAYNKNPDAFSDRLVRFKLKENGKLACLDLPEINTKDEFEPEENADNKLTQYVWNGASDYKYKSNMFACAPYFSMSRAAVFVIPTDLSQTEAYRLESSSYFYNDQSLSTAQTLVYDLDESHSAGAVVYREAGGKHNIYSEANSAMIIKLKEAVNKSNDTGYEVEILEAGQYKYYFMPETVTVEKTAGGYRTNDGSVLCKGDIVRYTIDKNGEIDRMIVDFDANPEIMRPNESKDSAPFNGNNQTPMYQEGCVYEANGAYITLSNEKSGGTYDFSFNNLRLYGAGTTNIICYDMNTNEISVISGSEIYTKRTDGDSADYVVLRQNNYAPAAIFVYRRMEGWQ